MILHLDFETRSTLELPDVGLDRYAAHPTTDVWCVAYAEGDGAPRLLTPEGFQDFCPIGPDDLVYAHNAAFELAIWNQIMAPRYGWTPLKPSQMRCTMAMAYAMALPGSLEKAAAALGITEQKDLKGGRLMLQMSRPRGFDVLGDPIWWDDAAKLQTLYDYCKQDVRVEQQLTTRLFPLSTSEQQLWELDYAINHRGLPLDASAIAAALAIIAVEQRRLEARIRELTDGAVGSPAEVAGLTRWITAQGVAIDSLARADVGALLHRDGLPSCVHDALLCRQDYAKTSTAKLGRMRDAISADGRIKYTMQYHGAATGRWAGRRIQPHNMPRPSISHQEVDAILDTIPTLPTARATEYIGALYGEPLSIISDCLRGLICAPEGKTLVAGDFANIEGRVLAWLAGETWKLDAFRAFDEQTGPDIYKLSYAKSFGIPVESVTKDQRFVGKVQELALGYQGGVGAFQTMARGYGLTITDERANEIKVLWREAHPCIVAFWFDLERAVYDAMTHPQVVVPCRATSFVVKGSFLFCRLPSGRVLTYPYPKLKMIETPWGEMKEQLHYLKVNGLSNKWEETHTYGGSLAENITQAVARDVLAEALTRVSANGYDVILHVHDEIVAEMPEQGNWTENFCTQMAVVPKWATGLPIAVEGWQGQRYRK